MSESKSEKSEKIVNGLKEKDSEAKKAEKKESSVFKHYTISIKNDEIENEFILSLKKYGSEIKLPGFRKGKVPEEVVRSKYGEGIRDEVIEKLIEKKTLENIKKDNLNVVSNPIVENIDGEKGKDLKVKVKVELFPEIELPDLEKIEIKINKSDLKDEKYDEKMQIDAVLEANKKKVGVSGRVIQDGDQIDLTIQSQFTDSKKMTPKKDIVYNVEQNAAFEIKDFYKEILGKKAGDSLELSRSYPKNYEKKSWAGKKLKHYVKIKKVYEFVKPELNEEFLIAAQFKDEKTFKTELKKRFDDHVNHHKEEKIFNEIKKQITEKIVFDVPETLVINEVNRTAGQYGELIMSLPEDKRREYLDSLKSGAEQSLKFSLILDEIIKKFNIKAESDEIEKEMKAISDANNIDIMEVRKYYSDQKNRESLKNGILSRKSVDFLRSKVKIKEV